MFLTKKLWLRGGLIGAIVCIALFLFYIFLYFPTIDKIYAKEITIHGSTPAWTTTIPLATGHLLPLLSSFIVPHGFMCEFTVPICNAWSATPEPGAQPWTMEGQDGYCIEQTLTPTESCANLSGTVGFWSLATLLIAIYFGVGSGIGWFIQRRSSITDH